MGVLGRLIRGDDQWERMSAGDQQTTAQLNYSETALAAPPAMASNAQTWF
jgi:hypothetical protein